MLKYINSNLLVDEIKNELAYYFDENMADESILYSTIKYCVSKFKWDHHETVPYIINLENKEGVLPEDLVRICIALGCTTSRVKCENGFQGIHTEEREVCKLDRCESECEVKRDECGRMYKVIQTFNDLETHNVWDTFDLVKINNKEICVKDCFNFKSRNPNEVRIQNGKIYTNFDGLVYIEYIKNLETKDGFNIIDNETILDWIKWELKVKIIQHVYLNTKEEVINKLRYSESKLHIAKENARALIKRFERGDFVKLQNELISRYDNHKDHIYNELHARYIGW